MISNLASIETLSIGDDVVSTRQVKAARALLDWSQADLAKKSGVSEPTIWRLEADDGELGGRADTVEKIRRALEKAGVEFTNGKRPGVRLKTR
jgi:predicted transcriptional regulator